MKTFILATAVAATLIASALSVQAANRPAPIDGVKFFEDIANRSGF